MKMTTLTANSRQKKKSFLTAVQELELATKGVQSYSKDIQAVETLQLDINALKAQLEKKDRDLLEERNRATSEKDKQTELSVHFEERSAEWVSQREELKLELEKCRAASKESREKHNTDLQKQIRALQEQNDQKAHEIDKKRTTITGLESRLMSSSNALKNLKSKIGWQEIGSNFIADLKSLETDLKNLTKNYFCAELFLSVNHKAQILRELRQSLPQQHGINLAGIFPFSNELGPMNLRAAVMESLIAIYIAVEIFQDSRIVATDKNIKMNEKLDDFVKCDAVREATIRSLLHELFGNEEMDLRNHAISEVISDISKISRPLLSHTFDQFSAELRDLLERAATIWEKAQRSPEKVLCSINLREFEDWNARQFDATGDFFEDHFNDVSLRYPEIVLFPRIWLYSKKEALHAGTAIWSAQIMMLSRLSESEKDEANASHRLSPKKKLDRRGSINGSIPKEEASSASIVSRNGSFLQRSKNLPA